MILDSALLLLGLLLLFLGGEGLVRGATALAKRLEIPTLIIGLTVVALGTGAPELAVSIIATLQDKPSIAIGNVIGSNIANILLVGGVASIIFPLVVKSQLLRREAPFLIASTFLITIMLYQDVIPRWQGITLIGFLVMVTYYIFKTAKSTGDHLIEEQIEEVESQLHLKLSLPVSIIILLLSLALLIGGSHIFVESASNIARHFNISEAVIGLTIVAFGTSAPELVTSVVAAYRKHTDIAVGNIIGSNLFNLIAIIGITSTVNPLSVDPTFIAFDAWFMVIITCIFTFMMFMGKRIGRIDGVILFAAYLAYIYYAYSAQKIS